MLTVKNIITHKVGIGCYIIQKKEPFIFCHTEENGIYLAYKKRDKFKLICNPSPTEFENQQTGHIHYELNSPKLNSKTAENFFKNENLDQLSDAEKKTTLLNNFTLKITSSLNLDLPKSSQFASKVYHITR